MVKKNCRKMSKKLILSESAIRLLAERYNMELSLYPLARLIFDRITKTNIYQNLEQGKSRYVSIDDAVTNPAFTIQDNEVARYYNGDDVRDIDVCVANDEDNEGQIAYFSMPDDGGPYIMMVNLAAYASLDKSTIVDKMAHELTHLADKDEFQYDNEAWKERSSANDYSGVQTGSKLDRAAELYEYFQPKELNAMANEAYSYFYNNLDRLFVVINNCLNNDGSADADDIIRRMFLETKSWSRISKLTELVAMIRDDKYVANGNMYRGQVPMDSIVMILTWDALNWHQFPKFYNTSGLVQITDENTFNQNKEYLFNIFKKSFNQYCAFLYWEYRELLKYTIKTYYNKEDNNNGQGNS